MYVARRMAEAFGGRSIDDLQELLAKDYLDHQGLGAGPLVGPDGFREVVAKSRQSFRELVVTVEDLFSSGSYIAMRLRWIGERLDGTSAERETIEVIRFADGKAVEHWGHRTT